MNIYNPVILNRLSVLFYLFSIGLPIPPVYSLCVIGIVGTFTTQAIDETYINNKKMFFILFIYLVLTSISCVFSINVTQSIKMSSYILPCIILYYLTIKNFKLDTLNYIFITLSSTSILISTLLFLVIIFNPSLSPTEWIKLASFSNITVPNDLIILALYSPISLSIIYVTKKMTLKVLSFISLLFSLITIMFFLSRTSFAVYLVSLFCMFSLIKPKNALVFAVLLIPMIFIADSFNHHLLLNKITSLPTWTARIPLWLAAWHIFLDSPFFGSGSGSFALLIDSYLNNIVVPDWVYRDSRHIPWAHNLYLETMAERGIIGILFLVYFLIYLGGVLWKTYKINEFYTKIMASAVLSMLVGILIAGMFELSLNRHWFLVILSVIAALTTILSEQSQSLIKIKSE